MLHIIVNCGPAENYIGECLASIRSQTFDTWQAFVSIDPVGDGTARRAEDARGDDTRIELHLNAEWQGPMVNTIQAISRSNAQPDDVFVVLDGDDRFSTPDALGIIDRTYREVDCWLTYGSWLSDLPDGLGLWPAYPDGLEDFRSHQWLGTAVRTWKSWLWELIDDSDFRDASGTYFTVTEDQAILLPMLEMSGHRARHIPRVLVTYRRSSPHRVAYTRDAESRRTSEYITSLRPYPRLIERPCTTEAADRFLSERRRLTRGLQPF